MPLIDELSTTTLSHYFSADYLAARAPGPHLKAIIDDFLEYHDLSARKRNADFASSLEEFGSLGFAWERAAIDAITGGAADLRPLVDEATPAAVRRIYEHMFSRALTAGWRDSHATSIVRPGETTHRGIHCNCDAINVRLPRTELFAAGAGPEEFKCTWGSAAGGLEAHPDWLMQVPGYCTAYGFEQGVIRALFVNGYYEKGRMGAPVIRAWRLRWSDEERDENWSLIEGHREVIETEGRLWAAGETNS